MLQKQPWVTPLNTWLSMLGKNGNSQFIVVAYGDKETLFQGDKASFEAKGDAIFNSSRPCHVFAIVNSGGTKSDEINKFHALFTEHDDLAKQLPEFADFNKKTAPDELYARYAAENKRLSYELVTQKIAEGVLPMFSLCVDTGGLSYHWFWALSGDCTRDQWTTAQRRLCAFLGGDKSLKDTCRNMRVPGFKHPRTGLQCRIHEIGSDPSDPLFGAMPQYNIEQLLEVLPLTPEEHRISQGKQRQQEWVDKQPAPKKSPKSRATFRFFENLDETSKRACAIEMLGVISQEYGRPEEGGYVSNEIQGEFIYGLFREFRNLSDEDQLKMLEAGFGAWRSDSHSGANFSAWRKGILAKSHGQGIGTVIMFARKCGWISKNWEQKAGKDEASIVCQIIDDHLDGALDYLFWQEAFYQKGEGNFHYDMIQTTELRKLLDDIICENFSTKAGTQMIDNAIKYIEDRRTPINESVVNPDGWVLVKNGILRVSPEEIKLYDYDDPQVQDLCFLDSPKFAYKPDMDNSEADKLWECWGSGESLDLAQRIIGSSLNIGAIRAVGRRTPGLFALGEGQNGKGMWETILRLIYGQSACSGVDLQEFHKHATDKHSAYLMPHLIGSRVNFPAENPCAFLLDKCESYRTVITGERMIVRQIKKPPQPTNCRCINIFPLNDAALLNNTKENVRSRVRAIYMPYVYTTQPDPRDPNQKPLNPKYVYDNPKYKDLWEEVYLPGILNRMIEGWQRAYENDYPRKESDAVITKMKRGSNPFDEFMEYLDLEIHPSSAEYWEVSVTDILEGYRQWLVVTDRGEVNSVTKRFRVDNPHLPKDRDSLEKRLKDFKIETRRIPAARAKEKNATQGFYCVNVTANDRRKLVYDPTKTHESGIDGFYP